MDDGEEEEDQENKQEDNNGSVDLFEKKGSEQDEDSDEMKDDILHMATQLPLDFTEIEPEKKKDSGPELHLLIKTLKITLSCGYENLGIFF